MSFRRPILLISISLILLVVYFSTSAETVIDTRATISDETPYIEYPFVVDITGSTVTITMRPEADSELDTLLYLVDAQDNIIAQNDDFGDNPADGSQIVYSEAAAGGYRVVATRYRVDRGKSAGDFHLDITITEPETDTLTYDVSADALNTAQYPAVEPRPIADWTIIAYYGGDTNLEPHILADFNEFELAGGSDDIVRIVAMVDRHPEFSRASGDWDTIRMFEIGADESGGATLEEQQILDTPELSDLGQGNTANGENLAQFLVWALQNYPARQYAVTFASHGAGWEGLIKDDTADGQLLSLPELEAAFRVATETTGITGFDLLINDACLMSSVEYQSVMSTYFDYSLASPEIVINPALDMTLLTETLRDNPQVALDQLGKTLVDTYMNRDMAALTTSDRVYLTSAMIQLNQYDRLHTAVESFAAIINESPIAYATMLGSARQATYEYSSFVGNDTLIDLGSFMREVLIRTTDERVIDAGQTVLQELRAVVNYGVSGERVNNTTTYNNIYFPRNAGDFKADYFTASPLTEWGRMLRNYYSILTPQPWLPDDQIAFHLPVTPEIVITGIYPDQGNVINPIHLNYEVVGRKIATGEFIVDQVSDDGTITRLFSAGLNNPEDAFIPGVEVGAFVWDTTLFQLSDGQVSNLELITINSDLSFLEGRYRAIDSETWFDVAVMFDYDDVAGHGEVVNVISRDLNSEAVAVINIPEDAVFQTYQTQVNENGSLSRVPGNSYTWKPGEMTIDYLAPAPSGTYRIGFSVTNFSGNTTENIQTVQLNNDDVDASLRATSQLDTGFVLRYPAQWREAEVTSPDILLTLFNPANDAVIQVISIDTFLVESTVEDVLTTFEDERGAIVDYDSLTPITVSDETVTAFTFTSAFDEVGRGFVRLRDNGFLTDLFIVTDTEESDTLDQLYDLLTEQTLLFEPVNFANDWSQYEFPLYDTVRTPIPIAWENNGFDDRFWYGYASSAAPDNQSAIVKFAQFVGEDTDSIMAELIADEVQAGGEDYVELRRRPYYAELATWQVTEYTINRDDVTRLGRLYVTVTADYTAHVILVEAPLDQIISIDDTTINPMSRIFEIIVDGYIIDSPLRTYRNDIHDFALKYPAEWSYLEDDFTIENAYSSYSGDGQTSLWIYTFDDTETTQDVIEAFTDTFDVTEFYEGDTGISLGGTTGDAFSYVLEDTYFSYGYATVVNETGFIFAIETTREATDETEEEIIELLNTVLSELRFGSAEALATEPPEIDGTYEYPTVTIDDEFFSGTFNLPVNWADPIAIDDIGAFYFGSPSGESFVEFVYEDYDSFFLEDLRTFAESVEVIMQGEREIARFTIFEPAFDEEPVFQKGLAYRYDENTLFKLRVVSPSAETVDYISAIVLESFAIDETIPVLPLTGEAPENLTPETISPASLKTFTDVDFGIQFDYPADWDDFVLEDSVMISYSADGMTSIVVSAFEAEGETDALAMAEMFGFDTLEAAQINDFDGAIGIIDYDFEILFSINVIVPELDVLVSIDLYGTQEDIDALYEIMQTSLAPYLPDANHTTRTFAKYLSDEWYQPPPPPPPPGTDPTTEPIAELPSIRSPFTGNERYEYFGYIADAIQFSFEYPEGWSAFIADREKEVDIAWDENEETFVTVRILEATSQEILKRVDEFYTLETAEPVIHNAALMVHFTYNEPVPDESTYRSGRGMAFDLVNADSQVIITVETISPTPINFSGDKAAEAINTTYETVLGTLNFDEVDVTDLTLVELPLRSFQDSTIGFEIEYPIVWSNMQFDNDMLWYVTLSNSNDAALYIYPIFGQEDLRNTAEQMLTTYEITRNSAYTETTLNGYPALEFDVSYKYNGDWFGRAIVVNLDGVGLVFSVDLIGQMDTVIPFYERIISTITLPQ